MRTLIALLMGGLFLTNSVGAASITAKLIAPNGKVLVNTGEGFVLASDGMVLQAGDRILAGAGSTATISYPGCAVVLPEASFHTVSVKEPCVQGQAVLPQQSLMISPAFGSGGFGDTDPAGLLAVGVVLSLAAGVGLLATSYDDPDTIPVSPP